MKGASPGPKTVKKKNGKAASVTEWIVAISALITSLTGLGTLIYIFLNNR
jgi:hypothetical protein